MRSRGWTAFLLGPEWRLCPSFRCEPAMENAPVVWGKGIPQGCQGLNIYGDPGCSVSRVAIEKKIKEISTSAKMLHLIDLRLDAVAH